MSTKPFRLSGRKFFQKYVRDTHFRAVFTIFLRLEGIEYIQFAVEYKRGQFTKDRDQAMRDARPIIPEGYSEKSEDFRQAALKIFSADVFKAVKQHGRHTKRSVAIDKRLVAIAGLLMQAEKTRKPKKGEILLVALPFEADGTMLVPNTSIVNLNPKDPMKIIGDTVKDVVLWTTMIYADVFKISGLE